MARLHEFALKGLAAAHQIPHPLFGFARDPDATEFPRAVSLGSVLVWTVFARIVRIAPTFAVVAAMRLLFGRRIDARATAWCLLLGLFWLAFYVFYFVRMSRV